VASRPARARRFHVELLVHRRHRNDPLDEQKDHHVRLFDCNNDGAYLRTYLNLSATGQETITVTTVAGNAKINANGSFNVCFWNTSDGSLYERSVGTLTL